MEALTSLCVHGMACLVLICLPSYGHHTDIVLPQDCTFAHWTVYDGTKFVIEAQVTCVPAPAVPPLPAKYANLVQARKDLYKTEVDELQAEVGAAVTCCDLLWPAF